MSPRPALLLLPLLLVACAGGPARDPGPLVPISVALALPTLPAAAELELRLSRVDENGAVVELLVQQLVSLPAGSAPASAELALPQASLDAGAGQVVEALLRDADGRVLLATVAAPVSIEAGRGRAGPLRSPAVEGEDAAPLQPYRCGEVAVVVAMEGNELLLALDGAGYRLQPIEAASGARFARDGEPPVAFWSRGDSATLSVDGNTLPECRRTP